MEYTLGDLDELLVNQNRLLKKIQKDGFTEAHMPDVIKMCVKFMKLHCFTINTSKKLIYGFVDTIPREFPDNRLALLRDEPSKINTIFLVCPHMRRTFKFIRENSKWSCTHSLDEINNDTYSTYRDRLIQIQLTKQHKEICERMARLEEMIKYIPGGMGFDEAKRHFEKASGQKSKRRTRHKSKTSSAKSIEGQS